MTQFHPDLAVARYIPRFSWGPRLVGLMSRAEPRPSDPGPGVRVDEIELPGADGQPPVSVRLLRPSNPSSATAALLWVHGGGLIFGSPEQDDRTNLEIVRRLGIAVAAVRYRLAPSHTAPAAVFDAYSALVGIVDRAEELGIDPSRIAIGGASAGGGIAAALAQLSHDRGRVRPVFQLLVYPMLDDRTVTRTDMDTSGARIWSPGSNRYGWTSYLGVEPGSPEVPAYAAAARRESLDDLPPAWIGVGTLDLFHDEDLAYAARLEGADIPVQLDVVAGAFHGFDALFPKKGVSARFLDAQISALRTALT